MKSLPIAKGISDGEARALIALKLRKIFSNTCKRILIINPPQIPESDFRIKQALNNRYWVYQPYGPGVLCRNLEMRGYETDILDLNFEILFAAHEEKENFNYKKWQEKLALKLEEFVPDIVGVSCMFTMTHAIMKQISNALKEKNPKLPVVAGGVHLSNATKLVLEDCPSIDFIGLYECDHSFPDLVDFINGKLEADKLYQVATIISGNYLEIRDRLIPEETSIQVSPLYHGLPIDLYNDLGQIGTYGFMRKNRKASSLLRARGCRAHCSFCSVAAFNGPGVRERNYLNVIEEIEELIGRYGIRHITFLDDDLLSDRKDVLALFNEIEKRKLDITWDASNGLIAAAITPELMDAMVRSGCVGFNLGIESGNPEILRSVHKPGTVESFRKCKTIIDKYPQVFVKGFLIIGFPNETLKMMFDTLNLGLELELDWYSIQILNPLPSTEIYGFMIEQGLIQDGLETSNVAFVFGPHGKQKQWEDEQKVVAADFRVNLSSDYDLNSIPPNDQLRDYWFFMDYKLNYEKLLGIKDLVKLEKIGKTLEDISMRIAPENPLGHLFMGFIDSKLGRLADLKNRISVARKIVTDSAYWQKRFEAFRLYDLMKELEEC